jgi:tripartite-type tricarboxylate transporter receptor subunit TctC
LRPRAQASGAFKFLNIIVGFSPGGGCDAGARALSHHLDHYKDWVFLRKDLCTK